MLGGIMEYDMRVRTANIYNMILQRCYNDKFSNYSGYGGRGIYVSDEWLTDPTSFFTWYRENWFDGGQVDRIDNNGPYSSDNCRMSSAKQNGRNRRVTANVTAFGESKNCAAWVEDPRCHVKNWRTLDRRIRMGVDPEVAMSENYKAVRYAKSKKTLRTTFRQITAFGESKSLSDWAEDPRCNTTMKNLHIRLKHGWEPEEAITAPKNSRYKKTDKWDESRGVTSE